MIQKQMLLTKEVGYGLTSNSGGPSSASSGDCSSPILLIKRQRVKFRARKYFKMSEAAVEHNSLLQSLSKTSELTSAPTRHSR